MLMTKMAKNHRQHPKIVTNTFRPQHPSPTSMLPSLPLPLQPDLDATVEFSSLLWSDNEAKWKIVCVLLIVPTKKSIGNIFIFLILKDTVVQGLL